LVRFGVGGVLLICVLAQLLALPVLGIALQDEAQLAEFHNHALAPWPDADVLSADPTAYVRAGRTWLNEHVFPVQLATRTQKTVFLRWFREPPEPRVSLGDDGHIFLNGGSNQTLFGLFATACEHAHSEDVVSALQRALRYWSGPTLRREIATDFVVIPTAATLYADKLPPATPAHHRQACLERMQGRSPLLFDQPHFEYPLLEMLAGKSDPAFYPKGNWHATGLSLQVVRNVYLAKLGKRGVVNEDLRLEHGPAEILLTYGIVWDRPHYTLKNPAVTNAPEDNSRVRRAVAQLFRGDRFVTHAFHSARPVLDETVLMLSDSFGDAAAEVFAGAFRTLIQINLNDLSAGRPSDVIEQVQQVMRLDRVVFLVQEGNAPQLAAWR
jgi:hypothetical protein